MTHTPGPYTIKGSAATADLDIMAHDSTLCVAMVNCAEELVISEAEQDANATLFAAAPETAAECDRLRARNAELLARLQNVLAMFDYEGDIAEAPDAAGNLDDARATIAKHSSKIATGC